MDNTLMMSGLNYKLMNEVKSDNMITDIIIAMIIGTLITKLMNFNIFYYIEDLFNRFDFECFKEKKYRIEFVSLKNDKKTTENSLNYKAVMHYISSTKNDTIYKLSENYCKEYNYQSDNWSHDSFYKVNQRKFKITDKIDGEMKIESKSEKSRTGDEIKINCEHFIISSYKLNLLNLQKWINQKKIEYDKYLKEQLDTTKNILICNWDSKDKYFKIERREWKTTANFNNKFFEDKETIVKSIMDFEKGEKFYMDKGLEYQYGIMLSGEPGCGKTTFIKCVAQLTKRIIIIVKWTDDSNLEELAKLILGERIGDYAINHKKRLWVFEDIDAMGDIVRDRDLVEKERKDKEKIILKMMKEPSSPTNQIMEPKIKADNSSIENVSAHNNLSTYLNAIQGIEESHGRMIISTTNKPETIDPAVMRPGRIDCHLVMKKANRQVILENLNYYYNDLRLIDCIPLNLNYKYTMAEISGKCKNCKSFDECLQKLILLD